MQPTHVITAPRASITGQLRLGCSAVLFDETGTRVLLTRRSDNGLWCLPGGKVDPGECVAESIEREVLEETNLQVTAIKLVGVYSDPDMLVVYPDGNRVHFIVLCFLVNRVSGQISICNETTDVKFFPVTDALQMNLFHNHAEHLRDAFTKNEGAFIK